MNTIQHFGIQPALPVRDMDRKPLFEHQRVSINPIDRNRLSLNPPIQFLHRTNCGWQALSAHRVVYFSWRDQAAELVLALQENPRVLPPPHTSPECDWRYRL